jgi:hypothetical protein
MTIHSPSEDEPSVSEYIVLVPRGLHCVFAEILLYYASQQPETAISLNSDKKKNPPLIPCPFKISMIGEPPSCEQEAYITHVQNLVQAQHCKKKHKQQEQHGNRARDVAKDALMESYHPCVGTLYDGERHVSLGYHGTKAVTSGTGQIAGTVALQLCTHMPVQRLARMRCLGPLLALADVWEHLMLSPSKTLQETVEYMQEYSATKASSLNGWNRAIHVWYQHAHQCWNLSTVQHTELSERYATSTLRYRVSCLRTDSKRYAYTRRDFITAVVDILVPLDITQDWIVDLVQYDIEIVILVLSHGISVGIALRPYRQLELKSFSTGNLPADIHFPYAPHQIMSDVVRLRPSTTHALLSLARLQPGDVVLDPCVGMGTIPIEASLIYPSVYALGGDLVLTPEALGLRVAGYAQRIQHTYGSPQRGADLNAWDATLLPLRNVLLRITCIISFPCFLRKWRA